ncbi:MAG TPA: glycine cleavage system aminomethyltransferase GcvT [Chthoniobacterales bacterium]
MDSEPGRRTPLFDEHRQLGAKVIGFGGWDMPVFYSGIAHEHLAVRSRVGIFDISHMGELVVEGPRATAWLNAQLANNVEKLVVGEGQYTFLLNEKGGVLDDLIIYRVAAQSYLLVVNAALIEADDQALREALVPGVELRNESDQYAAVAVQGPRSVELFATWGVLPARNRMAQRPLFGTSVWVARTGYTGEDGFEAFFPAEQGVKVWRELLAAGAPLGLIPCGLGARDTLRLEACYPLNGADLSPARSPLAAGLKAFVDLNKGEFRGRDALLAELAAGIQERLVAVRLTDKAPPPRAHYALHAASNKVGELTSGTLSPSLNAGIGLGYVQAPWAKPGQPLELEIRGRRFPATVEKKPLYKRPC